MQYHFKNWQWQNKEQCCRCGSLDAHCQQYRAYHLMRVLRLTVSFCWPKQFRMCHWGDFLVMSGLALPCWGSSTDSVILLSTDDVAFPLNLFLQVVDGVADDLLLVVLNPSPEQLLDLVKGSTLRFRNKDGAKDEDQECDGTEAPEDGRSTDGLRQRLEALRHAEAQGPVERGWNVRKNFWSWDLVWQLSSFQDKGSVKYPWDLHCYFTFD